MNNIAIKSENLSKVYQLGEIGTGTISRDLERWWASMRGKEDPFLKVGEVNDRSKKSNSNSVWSLKDINFEIGQGDVVGIIGKNGAGKSTLLKILSRVTSPTAGSVKINGRVASLLEVGTGFHPELTGRENVFLNGAILGMRKVEIKKQFDAIVDFSGVERYVDTPVKRYSSGMYVRLAFAVAAHLESEILIVDEVLAVGDAEFQKKCLGKMGDVSSKEGRTVLFVSHNLHAVKNLCKNGLVLNQGKAQSFSKIEDALNSYSTIDHNEIRNVYENSSSVTRKKFNKIEIKTNFRDRFEQSYQLEIFCYVNNFELNDVVGIQVYNSDNTLLIHSSTEFHNDFHSSGKIKCVIPANLFNVGIYKFDFVFAVRNKLIYDSVADALFIKFADHVFSVSSTKPEDWKGSISPRIVKWSNE